MANRAAILTGVALFVVALAIRLAYLEFYETDTPIRGDQVRYSRLAHNLVNRGVFTYRNQEDSRHTGEVVPGYPLLLAAILWWKPDFQEFYAWTLYCQAAVGALTSVVVFAIGMRILPFAGALVVGILAAIAPHQVTICGYVLTECTFTAVLAVAIFTLIVGLQDQKLVFMALFGGLIGLATLIRPAILLFPVPVLPLLWLRFRGRRFFLAASIMLPGILLFLCPWAIWKHFYVVPGPDDYSPSAASFALGGYPDLIFRNPELRGYPYREDPKYEEMIRSLGAALRVQSERAAARPGRYLRWYLLEKPITYWSWDDAQNAEGPYIYDFDASLYQRIPIANRTFTVFRILHPVFVIVAFLAGIRLIFQLFRFQERSPKSIAALVTLVILVYFTAIHVVLAPLGRYAVPVHAMMYILAVFGMVEGFRFFRTATRQRKHQKKPNKRLAKRRGSR